MREPGEEHVARPLGRAGKGGRFCRLYGGEHLGKPSREIIRTVILGWYNEEIDREILSGFVYEGMPVWLSSENQFNYKAAHDLAVQNGGATLPVTFKFGTDEEPRYRTFGKLEELTDFYTKAMKHIQDTLADGWKKKDAFDPEKYRVE